MVSTFKHSHTFGLLVWGSSPSGVWARASVKNYFGEFSAAKMLLITAIFTILVQKRSVKSQPGQNNTFSCWYWDIFLLWSQQLSTYVLYTACHVWYNPTQGYENVDI